ncbi:hypothetical protein [Methanooceanicella nereidis]|nr:hypothetical protein [Methanocella sp. CWC-04]
MICPSCGSEDCIRPLEYVLDRASSIYAPCGKCRNAAPLDKTAPFNELGLTFGIDAKRCPSCGKRHMDHIMAHALEILIKNKKKGKSSALKDTGTPLIEYGVPLLEPPRLGSRSLILVTDNVDKKTAGQIIDQVPEIKGILKRSENPSKSVGLLDTDRKPYLYELMAGCDMRADLVSSMLGDLLFYRNQSEMHIEFRRNDSIKIKMIEKLFLEGMLEGKVVVDGLASVGTLGLFAALSGAKKVVLNDAWLPAVRNILINIDVNSSALGVRMERTCELEGLPQIAGVPVLVAKASGNVEIEVYHGDLRKLDGPVPSCDICIIDTFPGVSNEVFLRKWEKLSGRVLTL